MDKTYCLNSKNCDKTYCPRHLGKFNGLYVSLAEFNCEEELGEAKNIRKNEAKNN